MYTLCEVKITEHNIIATKKKRKKSFDYQILYIDHEKEEKKQRTIV